MSGVRIQIISLVIHESVWPSDQSFGSLRGPGFYSCKSDIL